MAKHFIPKDAVTPISTENWFESVPYISAVFKDRMPAPNLDYFYAAFKLCSEFPYINSKGVSYVADDLTPDVVGSAVSVQANLRHKKTHQVVGSVIECEKADDGIEVLLRFDRDQAAFHGLDPTDMQPGNIFSSISLELSKDLQDSQFYIIDDEFNILKKLPYLKGLQQGIRRTDQSSDSPFLYQGKNRVVEIIKPLRITGVGLVPNPADKQAQVYAVAADDDTPERLIENMAKVNYPEYKPPNSQEALANHARMLENEKSYNLPQQYDMEEDVPDYIDIHTSDHDAMHQDAVSHMSASPKVPDNAKPTDSGPQIDKIKRFYLQTAPHTAAAVAHFSKPKTRAKYEPEQQSHIMKTISAAKRRFNIADTKEQASIDAAQELQMTESEKALTERFSALEAALASIKNEKETASVEITTAKEQIVKLEKEVASMTAERDALKVVADTLKVEKETAARETALTTLISELEAIKASADDAGKASLKEQASTAVGNDLLIRALKAERLVESLKEIASKQVTETEEDKAKRLQAEKEKASAKETFSTSPEQKPTITPIYDPSVTDQKAKHEAIAKALLFV